MLLIYGDTGVNEKESADFAFLELLIYRKEERLD